MSVPNSSFLVADLLRSLGPELIVSKQGGEDSRAMLPAPAKQTPTRGETQPGPEFKSTLRANLRAAARHIMRGHQTLSFRECSRPACLNASNMIPYPVVVEKSVTDADLEVIFQRVMTAALEEVAANPLSDQTPDGWNEPELVS